MRRPLLIMVLVVLVAVPCAVFSTGTGQLTQVSAYPNPFDSRQEKTKIAYTLSEDRGVAVDIYSVYGARVWNCSIPPAVLGGRRGANYLTWDGRGSRGRKVAKGVYLAVVRAGSARTVVKIGVIH
ncbi:MAG: hypothetical protein ABIJ96_06940 [Elusimicrobiota bacterium]